MLLMSYSSVAAFKICQVMEIMHMRQKPDDLLLDLFPEFWFPLFGVQL